MSLMRGAAMRRKGEPVWVLVAIVGGWVGVRAATWDIMAGEMDGGQAFARAAPQPFHAPRNAARFAAPERAALHKAMGVGRGHGALPMPNAPLASPVRSDAGVGAGLGTGGMVMTVANGGGPNHAPGDALTVAVIDAGPPGGLSAPRAAGWLEAPAAPARAHRSLRRWSGDGWMLWRRDGDSATGGGSVLLPSYGANQVGGTLRYRLAPASRFRPTAYVRAYGALNGTGEREVAAGLSARPVPAVPVMVMGEARASHFAGGTTHIRPAVTVVSELPPVMLPGAMRAETYVQGGYVGGAASTAFVDGQFRLEHVAAHSAHAEVRLGGGVWGGAQTGAGRMDVGPTATVAFHTAGAGAHVSVDWRFRVAGNALPGSGPAVTLAAGF